MTDNDIIEALGRCKYHRECCFCNSVEECGNKRNLTISALDLISRQQAEIEQYKDYNAKWMEKCDELKAEIEMLKGEIDKQYEQAKADILGNMGDGGTSCHWCIEQHKAEAVKEFAEKINKEAEKVEIDREGDFVEADNEFYDTVANWCKAISNNLVKEMEENK